MSAFLAPIHQWLFNKIQKVNDRTELILEEARARYGDNAEEAQALAWESFGAPLASETSLAERNAAIPALSCSSSISSAPV